jgi:translation initiation factor 5B
LFDEFTAYVKKCRDDRKHDEGSKAVFPCVLEMVKGAVFNNKSPILIGVTVKSGILKVGTPLCVPERDKVRIGHVDSMQLNGKTVTKVLPKDGPVSVKIDGESQIMYGRHFDDTN